METILFEPKKPKTINQSDNSQRIRVAAYCRVSTADAEQFKSYESMVSYYEQKIRSHEGWDFAGIYADLAVTGTSTKNRDNFNRMIEDAEAGKMDYIIAKNISRYARNHIDTASTVARLRKCGVYVYFEEENLDTAAPTSDMVLNILSLTAQQEVQNTSEHVKKGLEMKMKRGELVGFNRCLGYRYDKETKQMSIDKKEAELVRYIFDRYIYGVGSTTIAEELNKKGIRTIKNNEWGSSTIVGIITNEKYMGDLKQGKTYTNNPIEKHRRINYGEAQMVYCKDHHEPIIDKETWDKAQTIHEIRNRGRVMGSTAKVEKYSRKYAFSSKIKCGFCGGTLSRRSWHGDSEDKYKKIIWHCCTSTKKGVQYCPDSKGIEERIIENAFIEAFNMMCGDNQGIIEKFLKRVEKSLEKDSAAPKTNKLESKIFDLTKKRQKLVDNYMDGTIDRDVYQTKDKDYKEELKELQKEYNHIKSQAMDKETVKERIENFRKILSDKQVMTAFDRDIFENMIDTIIAGGIDENGEKDPYKITFIFNTGYKQEIGNSKKQYKEKEKAEKCSLTVDEGKESVLSKSSTDTLSAWS